VIQNQNVSSEAFSKLTPDRESILAIGDEITILDALKELQAPGLLQLGKHHPVSYTLLKQPKRWQPCPD